MPLISVLRDIIAIWYHMFCDISAYVMVPGRWAAAASGTGSSWGARRSGLATEPKYWGQQSESYYPSFHIMIAVVVKFRTRPLRLIVTDIPPGVRRLVTRQTRSHWLQPQADSGPFKLRALIMPGVTQRWACARHRTSANNWDTTLYSAIAKNLKQISIIA